MGSIDPETLQVNGVCIKCQACIRFCPMQARALEDSDFLSHVAMLEEHYAARAEKHVSFVRQRAGELVGMVLFLCGRFSAVC